MPTGYTAVLQNNPDYPFKKFILDCARAFGACVTLREEGGGGEAIPNKFEERSYYDELLSDKKNELERIKNMSKKELDKAATKEYKNTIENAHNSLQEMKTLSKSYQRMIQEVENWQPPTEDHLNLKKFMLQQLKDSNEHDCNTEYYDSILKKTKKLSGEAWQCLTLTQLSKSISYYEEQSQKEKERVAQRNKWISDLRESIKDI